MEEKAVSIRTKLADMEIGQTLSYPLENVRTLRVLASECGLRLGRLYKTKSDRDTQTITVTRTK